MGAQGQRPVPWDRHGHAGEDDLRATGSRPPGPPQGFRPVSHDRGRRARLYFPRTWSVNWELPAAVRIWTGTNPGLSSGTVASAVLSFTYLNSLGWTDLKVTSLKQSLSGLKILVQHLYPGRSRNQGVAH